MSFAQKFVTKCWVWFNLCLSCWVWVNLCLSWVWLNLCVNCWGWNVLWRLDFESCWCFTVFLCVAMYSVAQCCTACCVSQPLWQLPIRRVTVSQCCHARCCLCCFVQYCLCCSVLPCTMLLVLQCTWYSIACVAVLPLTLECTAEPSSGFALQCFDFWAIFTLEQNISLCWNKIYLP